MSDELSCSDIKHFACENAVGKDGVKLYHKFINELGTHMNNCCLSVQNQIKRTNV